MPIEVRNDMSAQSIATAVQSNASRAGAATRSRGAARQEQPTAAPEPAYQAPPESLNDMLALKAGALTDGFNSYVDQFERYDIPEDQRRRFTSTWRAIVADQGLTTEQRLVGLQQVLDHGQVMIDGSPAKRNRPAEWLAAMKDNPDEFVTDLQGQVVANPWAASRKQERAEALAREREDRMQRAEERRKSAEQRTAERQALQDEQTKASTEYTKTRTDQLKLVLDNPDTPLSTKDKLKFASGQVDSAISSASQQLIVESARLRKYDEAADAAERAFAELPRPDQAWWVVNPPANVTPEQIAKWDADLRADITNATTRLTQASKLRGDAAARVEERRMLINLAYSQALGLTSLVDPAEITAEADKIIASLR